MASVLEVIQGGFAQVGQKLADVVNDVPAEWKRQLAAFKARANTFAGLYSDLQRMSGIASRSPALQTQYNAVMKEGNVIQKTVMDLLTKVGQSLSIVKSSDLSGGLGFVPLIPIAVIGGVVYTLDRWIGNAYAMKTKLATIDQAIKAGASPDAIAAEASKPLPLDKGVTGDIKDIMKYGLIFVGLYFGYQYLIKPGRSNAR